MIASGSPAPSGPSAANTARESRPDNAVVLCVDEKTRARSRADRPYLPILPTTPARQTHDYVRHGTTSLFAALKDVSGFGRALRTSSSNYYGRSATTLSWRISAIIDHALQIPSKANSGRCLHKMPAPGGYA